MNRTGFSRLRALALLGSAPLAACSGAAGSSKSVTVGSKDFTEELLVGEMYAQLLERAGFTVARKLNLGGTVVAMEALQHGDIDLYPEYTGTALLTVLKLPSGGSASSIYATVKSQFASKYRLQWLKPAPFNDSEALATTQAVSQKYNIKTLSQLAQAASQLRLGAIPEFVKRADGLPGLQKAFGGFQFKSVRLFDIGLKYTALLSGQVDVVVAFGTDGQIAANNLVMFVDDKKFWPTYQIAPVVRASTLAKYPEIAPALDKLAAYLTDPVMRDLNFQVDGKKADYEDVATDFLKSKSLV